nr:hypothetical protein [uncultured archaeon]
MINKKNLKPNIWNIILFIMLLIILVFLPIIPVKINVQCIKAPCYPVNSLTSFYSLITNSNKLVVPTIITYISIATEILMIYLISSILSLTLIKIVRR